MTQAPIALTCGEPAGVGVEIAAKAWERGKGGPVFFLIGDPRHVPGDIPTRVISSPQQAEAVFESAFPVLEHSFETPRTPGVSDPRHAKDVIAVIEKAVALTQSGEASAVCTAPINKKALKDGAGFAFPGHTEFLAHLGGVDDVVMMLASDLLRVVPTTIHIPLSAVPKALTPDLLEKTLRITDAALRQDFGLTSPRIAVAGLNPHAGEGGAMGTEDQAVIQPVVQKLADEGMALTGPHPADTLFHAKARERYDVAVCMYHDQALVPIKTLDFDRGVNVTLGLPFIRTSPDHGTAYDIAGTGTADPTSLIEALKLAARMAKARSNC